MADDIKERNDRTLHEHDGEVKVGMVAYLESPLRRNPSDFSRILASAIDSGDSLYPWKK
jgi:hypothetical protein